MRAAIRPEEAHRDALRLERYDLAAQCLADGDRELRLRNRGGADAIRMAPDWLARRLSIRTSSGLRSELYAGLAERGQRRAEGPPSGWIKFGLDSYIDPIYPLSLVAWSKSSAIRAAWCSG